MRGRERDRKRGRERKRDKVNVDALEHRARATSSIIKALGTKVAPVTMLRALSEYFSILLDIPPLPSY